MSKTKSTTHALKPNLPGLIKALHQIGRLRANNPAPEPDLMEALSQLDDASGLLLDVLSCNLPESVQGDALAAGAAIRAARWILVAALQRVAQ